MFESSDIIQANGLILVFGNEIDSPRSVQTDQYGVKYLGRFECDPDIKSSHSGDAPIPSLIHLLVSGSPGLSFQGKDGQAIPIDTRGLIIGREIPDSNIPRLDISEQVKTVAIDQVKIYQDQFDQWIIEDVGGNHLTRIDGEDLQLSKTFPWHGRKLSIGHIEFEWSIE